MEAGTGTKRVSIPTISEGHIESVFALVDRDGVPAFVKSEGPLAPGGPLWRIELVSPVWPNSSTDSAKEKK